MDQVTSFIQNNIPLAVLIGLTIIDIFSGLVAAGINGQIAGSIAFQGALKKTLQFFIVAVAYLVQTYAPAVPLTTLTISFYILSELTSIIENMQKAGISVPGEILAVSNTIGSVNVTPSFIQPAQPVATSGFVTTSGTGVSSNELSNSFSFSTPGTSVPATVRIESLSFPPLSQKGDDPIDVANDDPSSGTVSVL